MRYCIYIFLLAFFPISTWAHGVEYSVFNEGVGIEARYKDGTPIAFSDVSLYRPGNTGAVFQQGMTDKHGRFMFAPDTAGQWTIEVDDGMGHGLIKEITVSEALNLSDVSHHGMARWQEILVGVSIILGITGIGFYVMARKE
ncbi:MAG: hypothetical protein MAGBODY4_01310 [Candidatus Marinimicrobia bacterium]|nr:hypothetical protein [Candidatus Neomarinimicrobiota bacterium]